MEISGKLFQLCLQYQGSLKGFNASEWWPVRPPVLPAVCPYLLSTGRSAAHNWSWRFLRMNGTPASSPTVWRDAGKTYTYTCPDPPSLCGYLHPACLARKGRMGEPSKEDGVVADIVISGKDSHNSLKAVLCTRYTLFLNTLNYFPSRLCSLASERIH